MSRSSPVAIKPENFARIKTQARHSGFIIGIVTGWLAAKAKTSLDALNQPYRASAAALLVTGAGRVATTVKTEGLAIDNHLQDKFEHRDEIDNAGSNAFWSGMAVGAAFSSRGYFTDYIKDKITTFLGR
jgi:hypothetical protein